MRANPELLSLAVDEMLRWVSPVRSFMRTADRDYRLRDQEIQAGQALLMSFPSANRDEAVFAQPFAFKVDRKPNAHIAFGYGGDGVSGSSSREWSCVRCSANCCRASRRQLSGTTAWLPGITSGSLTRLPIRYRLRSA